MIFPLQSSYLTSLLSPSASNSASVQYSPFGFSERTKVGTRYQKGVTEAAARRERALVLTRFLQQSAQALLGRRAPAPRLAPCEAC